MLQFITSKSDKYSIAEEAQMVIEGGCQWIQVSNSLPEGTTLKETLQELKPVCEENEVFLVVDSDVELAQELRIHGVHLKKSDMKPAEARELLGPHAVIGVDADSTADIIALKGLDIDYAVVDYNDGSSSEAIRKIIDEVRSAGVEIHIVAKGIIPLSELPLLRQAGVNGFALSQQIIDAADPVAATAEILNALAK
ncbi:MAG: thiamine phosphate synthase [Muribaculaceae bacterium]|nr:thiamine phosphate synthase [Muribaculaceae bacterium]